MKRNTLVSTLLIIVLAITLAAWAGGKSGDGKGAGRITNLSVSPAMATVQFQVTKGSLWLAYTVRWTDDVEIDYQPIKVKKSGNKTIYYSNRPQPLQQVTVCLWKYKVSSKYCAKKNGSACQYCAKMGFHMEGRVDRQTGS